MDAGEQCPILRKFARVFSLPTMKQGERARIGRRSVSNSAQTAAAGAFCKYTRGSASALGSGPYPLHSLWRNVELAAAAVVAVPLPALINAGHPCRRNEQESRARLLRGGGSCIFANPHNSAAEVVGKKYEDDKRRRCLVQLI